MAGLVTRARFDAEAPMKLEAAILPDDRCYPFTAEKEIGILPIVEAVLQDIKTGTSAGIIAARFHNTVVKIIADTVRAIGRDSGIRTVALSGGVFQNRYVLERSEEALAADGFKILSQRKVPANDAGVALGQLAVAAAATGA